MVFNVDSAFIHLDDQERTSYGEVPNNVYKF